MRTTFFIMVMSIAQVFAVNSYSQSTRLSLNLKNVSAKTVLQQIEDISEFYFIYDATVVDVEKKVSIESESKSITKILDELFEGTNIIYRINNRQIALATAESLSSVNQQPRTVSGKVTDSSGGALPGVSVVVKGTANGVISDSNGNYSITNVPANAVLQFSFVGMKNQEISVEGKNTINVTLQEETIGIEEVVAIGYGTQKKVNLTGSVAVAREEVFQNKAVPNAVVALQGALPGVTVTRTSGKPGSEDIQMQIRGVTSANSVNALVIVDGAVGSLSELNPNDIESISVLKDAAAASIYGSNASGGVVLVTTKRGKAGKTVFEYSGMYGITNPDRMPHRLDSWVEMRMYGEAHANEGTSTTWQRPERLAWLEGKDLDVPDATGVSPNDFFPGKRFYIDPTRPNVWRTFDSVDKIKEVTKGHNPMQTHNVSIRGGNEQNSYFFSFGYYDRRGIMRYGPDSNERYNTRLNVNNELTKHISLNTSLAFTNNNIYQPAVGAESVLLSAYKLWSSDATYDPDGNYLAGNGIWANMVQEQKDGGRSTQKNYMFDGKADLKIKDVLPGLVFNVIGSKRIGSDKGFYNRRTLTYIGPMGTPHLIVNNPNQISRSSTFTNYSSLQAFANYNFSLNDTHNFTLLGGYSYEDYRQEFFNAGANKLVTNDFFSLSWGNASTKSNSDVIYTWATMAYFGRLNYNYKEKYLFEANYRYDGSSRLAPDVRWNAFPSLSVGWVIGNEDFFQGINAVKDLKLRASWGQLGNSNALGYYDYIGMLNSASNLPFGNVPTQYVYQNTIASTEITWETIETSNLGIDFSLFDRRLSFTGDVYIKKNKNMLAFLEVPSIIGVNLPAYNVGELETRGWEFNVGWKSKIGDFNYWANVNLADNTNELTRYEGRNIVGEGTVRLIQGMPLNTIWGYKTDGLFMSNKEYTDYGVYISPKTGQGDMKYLDLDDSKKIDVGAGTLENHGDLVKLGDTNPRYLFGINLGFRWKGLDFSTLLQGVGKRKILLNGDEVQPMRLDWKMPWREHLDYWTPENPDAFWPRLYANSNHSYWASDYWVQNAAYIRLKNIEIGYTIPQPVAQKAGIDKVRFFISGQDLWEWTNVFSFIDPEYPNNAGIVYPFYRTMSLGLNITF